MGPILHCVIVALAASIMYFHPTCLNGDFVYDDRGTITSNPVVLGQVPFEEIWRRDYWGQNDIRSAESHKSFRPLTSLTLYINAQQSLAEWGELKPFGFHLTNVILHVAVSVLTIPVTLHAFRSGLGSSLENDDQMQFDKRASLITALLFAVHPVHSEAVQNLTGRADVLMALMYLVGFWVYAAVLSREERISRQSGCLWPRKLLWITLILWVPLFSLFSVLSKETGFTLPMLCSFWDFFCISQLSLLDFRYIIPWTEKLADKSSHTIPPKVRLRRWIIRTFLLAVGVVCLISWRNSLNGGHEPSFRYNSNRQAIEPFKPAWAEWRKASKFAEINHSNVVLPRPHNYVAPEEIVGSDHGVHGLFRWLSMAVVWAHYLSSCLSPRPVLSCDWSGPSIPLMRTCNPFQDPRLFGVIAMLAACLFILRLGFLSRLGTHARLDHKTAVEARVLTCFAFYAFPFLLSSNLFVVTGTTVAERVAYLPSLGVCMGYGLIFSGWCDGLLSIYLPFRALFPLSGLQRRQRIEGRWILVSVIAAVMAHKCAERSFAWSNQVDLWAAAYEIAPHNAHTSQNYGVNLSLQGPEGVAKAIEVLGSTIKLPLMDRCDADEIFPTLAMCLNAAGRSEDALRVLAQGWAEVGDLADAVRRGVKIWHMHEVKADEGWTQRDALNRARLLAVQGRVLSRLDATAAAQAMVLAAKFGPGDPLVRRLATDLERDFRIAIEQQQ